MTHSVWLSALVFLTAFPLTGARAQVLRQVTGTATDILSTADLTSPTTTIAWDSSVASAKSESLVNVQCTGPRMGKEFTIKDEIGTAGAYPISVYPYVGDKIDTSTPPFALNSNFESVTFQCDGANNWVVE